MSDTPQGTEESTDSSVPTLKADDKISMARVLVRNQIEGPGMYFGGVLIPWPNPSALISKHANGTAANAAETTIPKLMALAGGSRAMGGSIAIKTRSKPKALGFTSLTGNEGRDEYDAKVGFNFEAYQDYVADVEIEAVLVSQADWQKAWNATAKIAAKEGIPGY